jgi:site-specific DNA-cytosine methylase
MEAASVAWEHMGWEPVGFCEIEPFPSAILKHRFPNVINYGDLTKFREWQIEPGTVDVLVGGTPCQAFSVAGLRKGLEDPRGNLALTFLALADKIKPRWILWENVPGVLTSSGGRDFYSFLSALGELGYGFAWSVLDAQHFGVPQRRRRVFVVAHLGAWEPAAEVLSIPEGMQRHLEESAKKGKGTSSRAKGGARSNGGESPGLFDGGSGRRDGGLMPPVAPTVCSKWSKGADAGKACDGSSANFVGEYWNGEERTSTLTTRSTEQRMPDKDQFMGVIVPEKAGCLDAQCGGNKLTHQSAILGHIIPEGSGSPTAIPFQKEQEA